MQEKLLEVKNLKTVFKTDHGLVQAVNDVSFDLYKGETLGIVGESGSGKSVTCMSLMGLIPTPPGRIESGSVLFEGKEILNIPNSQKRKIRGNKISMIFQDPMTSLNPYLRISTQMSEVLVLHKGMNKKEAIEKAADMLDKVGISGAHKRIYSYPHEFSGGMRQRVMIAMALLTDPALLIADEPTTALDVTIQAQILELIKKLQEELNMSLIMITHDLAVVAGMTDRINVMYAGHLIEQNTTEGLFAAPHHPYTYDLFCCVPRLDEEKKEKLYSIKGNPPSLINMPDACPFAPRCEKVSDECRKKKPELVKKSEHHNLRCFNPHT